MSDYLTYDEPGRRVTVRKDIAAQYSIELMDWHNQFRASVGLPPFKNMTLDEHVEQFKIIHGAWEYRTV